MNYYQEVFERDPDQADGSLLRVRAASAAIQASQAIAAQQTESGDHPKRLRDLALQWLRDDLESCIPLVTGDDPPQRIGVETLTRWLRTNDLAAVRDPEGLRSLGSNL